MQFGAGRVVEVRTLASGGSGAWIACPAGIVPAPGQYVLAHALDDGGAPLAASLFPGELSRDGFLALPPIPPGWSPGMALALRGPLGKGFHLPPDVRRLALVALGETVTRLLPLAMRAQSQGVEVALYTDCPLPPLPAFIEAHPLGVAPEALAWADLLALDLPLTALPALRESLGLGPQASLLCRAQALMGVPMPCAGIAGCGVCAVPSRRGYLLACQDGPVLDLRDIEW